MQLSAVQDRPPEIIPSRGGYRYRIGETLSLWFSSYQAAEVAASHPQRLVELGGHKYWTLTGDAKQF